MGKLKEPNRRVGSELNKNIHIALVGRISVEIGSEEGELLDVFLVWHAIDIFAHARLDLFFGKSHNSRFQRIRNASGRQKFFVDFFSLALLFVVYY